MGASHPLAICRWALVPPDVAPSGDWEMEVRAASDIAAGEELLLSYGERRCLACPIVLKPPM